MRPMSSATGMMSIGETVPRTGWFQRSSASQVDIRPDLRLTSG